MSRRLVLPLVFGILGTLVLAALGTWQLQRLAWKEGVIARIEEQLAAPPVALPAAPDAASDQYRRVAVEGRIGEGEIHVYTSIPPMGVGYRVVAPFEIADGRRVLLDRGFVPAAEKDAARPTGAVTVEGTLHWPQESDGWTPAPDREGNIWFARDVAPMAQALGTEPAMIVAAAVSPAAGPRPVPVSAEIPNNHLEYVVTWYGLAVVWAGMTVYWLWRMVRRPDAAAGGAGEGS